MDTKSPGMTELVDGITEINTIDISIYCMHHIVYYTVDAIRKLIHIVYHMMHCIFYTMRYTRYTTYHVLYALYLFSGWAKGFGLSV